MLQTIAQENILVIKQRKQLLEIIGFETRNKYEILTPNNVSIGFAAEQQKGILGSLLRQVVGHWRSFDIHIFDAQRVHQFIAHHPFRFYFQRLEVRTVQGEPIGHLEKQFSILSKKFQVYNDNNQESSQMHSGVFKIWTFPFLRNGKEVARINKKWGGALKEMFLDADNFVLEFIDPALTPKEKVVLLNAALFIDLMYFQNNRAKFNIGELIPG